MSVRLAGLAVGGALMLAVVAGCGTAAAPSTDRPPRSDMPSPVRSSPTATASSASTKRHHHHHHRAQPVPVTTTAPATPPLPPSPAPSSNPIPQNNAGDHDRGDQRRPPRGGPQRQSGSTSSPTGAT